MAGADARRAGCPATRACGRGGGRVGDDATRMVEAVAGTLGSMADFRFRRPIAKRSARFRRCRARGRGPGAAKNGAPGSQDRARFDAIFDEERHRGSCNRGSGGCPGAPCRLRCSSISIVTSRCCSCRSGCSAGDGPRRELHRLALSPCPDGSAHDRAQGRDRRRGRATTTCARPRNAHRVFGDLFALSTYFIPRSKLPDGCPRTCADAMGSTATPARRELQAAFQPLPLADPARLHHRRP